MGAISNLSDAVNRFTGGNSGTPEHLWAYKDPRVSAAAAAATIAGRWTSLWQYDGQPAAGSAPGAVAAPTNATDGALKQADPGGGRQKWLTGVSGFLHTGSVGTLVLYDRLLHISGLSGTTTTAQTVGGSLTRYTDGKGNMIWIEIYTQIGATSTTATCDYTDQDGGASTSPAFNIGNTGFREAQRIIPVPLAAGDYGVQGVTNVDLVATTGTAGDFGVTVAHPLVSIPCPGSGLGTLRSLVANFPMTVEIPTDACLAWLWIAGGAGAPGIFASLHMVEA